MSIALGSASQIALFVAPVLVMLSYLIGSALIDLHFWPGAVVMVIVATLTATLVTNGRPIGVVRRRVGVDGVHDLRHDALFVAGPNSVKGTLAAATVRGDDADKSMCNGPPPGESDTDGAETVAGHHSRSGRLTSGTIAQMVNRLRCQREELMNRLSLLGISLLTIAACAPQPSPPPAVTAAPAPGSPPNATTFFDGTYAGSFVQASLPGAPLRNARISGSRRP